MCSGEVRGFCVVEPQRASGLLPFHHPGSHVLLGRQLRSVSALSEAAWSLLNDNVNHLEDHTSHKIGAIYHMLLYSQSGI